MSLRRAATGVVVLLLVGVLPSGGARAKGRGFRASRFHIATAALQQRLSAGAQASCHAVGNYVGKKTFGKAFSPRGTAFITAVDPRRGTALVMTNAHVVFGRNVTRDGITFHPDGADGAPAFAKIRRLVAASVGLDYALLEVQLPAAMRGVKPLRLSRGRVDKGTHVYKIGYPALDEMKPWTMSLQQGGKRLARPQTALKTIASGRVRDGSATLRRAEYGTWLTTVSVATPGYLVDVPTFRGASGSPVISSATHEVVALHNLVHGPSQGLDAQAGRFRWGAAAVPMSSILADLAHKLAKGGAIPADVHGAVQQLVDPSATSN